MTSEVIVCVDLDNRGRAKAFANRLVNEVMDAAASIVVSFTPRVAASVATPVRVLAYITCDSTNVEKIEAIVSTLKSVPPPPEAPVLDRWT